MVRNLTPIILNIFTYLSNLLVNNQSPIAATAPPCKDALLTLLALWPCARPLPPSRDPSHPTWALTPHPRPLHSVDVVFILLEIWHPVLGHHSARILLSACPDFAHAHQAVLPVEAYLTLLRIRCSTPVLPPMGSPCSPCSRYESLMYEWCLSMKYLITIITRNAGWGFQCKTGFDRQLVK